MPHFPFRILHCAFRIRLRRYLPIASALGMAVALVWLLAALTRPAQASPPESVSQAVNAPTLFVDGSGGDDEESCRDRTKPCATIQRAIDVAVPNDTIAVAQGTYDTLNTKGGRSQVVFVDKAVAIEGGYDSSFFSTGSPSVLDPAGSGRAVVITGTEAVTLKNFQLTNGDASAAGLDGNGGCLLVGGSVEATIEQITIQNCTAARGGGLYIQGGTLNTSDITLQNNSATLNGGGLYLQGGTLNGNGLSVKNNSATENGGGVYVAGGAATISGGAIDNNNAVLGGGVYAEDGAFGLTGSTAANNSASDRGGALFVAGGTVIVGGGQVSGNRAPNGGGGGYAIGGGLHLAAGTVLENNTASDGEGQGLFLLGTAAILTGTTIQNHTGKTHAIFVQDGSLRLSTGSKLLNNSVEVGDGGAVYASGSSLSLVGTTATGNSAWTGNGGALFLITSTLAITDSSLTGNSVGFDNGAIVSGTQASDGVGGAIVVLTGSLSLANTTLSGNQAILDGGAIYGVQSPLTIEGGTIENNESVDGSGGAIFWIGESISVSGGAVLRNNKADEQPESARIAAERANGFTDAAAAGDAYLQAISAAQAREAVARGQVDSAAFVSADINRMLEMAAGAQPVPEPVAGHLASAPRREGSASPGSQARLDARIASPPVAGRVPVTSLNSTLVISSSGGAIYVLNAAVTLDGATVAQNIAGEAGGGLYVEGGSLTIGGTDSRYTDNEAQLNSGGALAITGTLVTIDDTTFRGNKAVNGAGVYALGGTFAANNNSLTTNHSIIDGGALYLSQSEVTLADNRMNQNLSDRGGGLFLRGGTATITRNEFQENNTTFRRPLLLNTATGLGVGVYIHGTQELSFTHNLVAKNTIPFRYDKVLAGVVTETVIINETDPPTIILPGPIYSDRTTADNGGGLYMQDGSGSLNDNTFLANAASLHGGALFVISSTLEMINNVIAQNSVAVSTSLGSAIYMSGTTISLVHNTIADNLHTHADGPFGRNVAIFLLGTGNNVQMFNNIIANHDIGAKGDVGAQITGGGNVWFGNRVRPWSTDLFPVETIHVLADPRFKDTSTSDYHIERTSAAHSAGVGTLDALGYEVLVDADGQPRSAPPDAGAFEHRYTRGLNVVQSASPPVLNKDTPVRYAITVTNHSKSSISGVTIADVLPAQQSAVSISTDKGTCDPGGLTCDLGSLAVGDVAVVTIDALTTGTPEPGALVEMVNTVNTNFPGMDPADNDTGIGHTTHLQDLVLDVTTVPTYTGGCAISLHDVLYETVQDAVDASLNEKDVVKVSGYCAGTLNLIQNLTVQGGWSTNMRDFNPALYTTTLDAAGGGTVIRALGQGVEPRVENLTLTGGSGGKGGGIYVSEASAVFSNVLIVGNTSASSGGGVYIDYFSVPKFFDSIIEENSVTTGGGGVYMVESGAKFDNVVIRNNTGAIDGGGVYILKGAPEFANSTILGHSVTGYGGGFFLQETGPQLRDNRIEGNTAGVGGGVYAYRAPASLKFNQILTNTATASPQFILIAPLEPGGGGGIYAERSDIKILNNIIEYNVANAGDGAGIHMWDFRQPEIIGNVIALNQGNGVYLRQTPGIFKLYILIPPVQPPPFGPELILPIPTPAAVRMRHNTIADNTGSGLFTFGETNTELVNNLIYQNGGGGVVTEEEAFFHLIVIFYSIPFVPVPIPIPIPLPVFFPPTTSLSYTYWGETGPDASLSPSLFADNTQETDLFGENPAFQNSLAGDYHLKRISPAFQTGKNTDVTEDMDATARNQGKKADIGADEYAFRETRYAAPAGGTAERCLNWKLPCSLQAAIDSANEGDLIKLDQGNYSTLTSRNGHSTVAYVDKSITIQGGYCSTTVAISNPLDCDWENPFPGLYPSILGPSGGRGLTIVGEVEPQILDVQITGNTAFEGGGMYVITATAFLSGMQIYANTATLGGGAYFIGAKSVLSNSQITANTAQQGGGLYFFQESETTVFSTTVSGNTASQGGGIFSNLSPAKIYSNSISANTATTGGGGVYLVDGEPKFQDNLVTGNSAPLGGGFYLYTGTQTVMSNTVQFNSAGQGAGIYLTASEGIVDSNVISANVALTDGGGIYATSAEANLKKNRVFSNTATSGGGVHLFAASDLVMQENRVYSNTAVVGGGLSLDSSSTVIEQSVISANTAITGAGLYLVNFSAAKLKGNTVLSNTAAGEGGGAYLKLSNANWEDSTFVSNTAQSGGGVHAKLSALLFKNNLVEGNTALTLGGGVYLDESSTSIQESRIYSNTASQEGGGLYILRSSGASVVDTEVRGNQAISNGGGLLINDSNMTLKNNQIISNSAGLLGGGLYINKSILAADRQMISQNSAEAGAGAYMTNRADGSFSASVLTNNQATGSGGALYLSGSSPSLYQTTIARNGGDEAIYLGSFGLNNSAPAFINTIISQQPVAIQVTAANSATLDGTLWHEVTDEWIGPVELYTGTVNIYDDPRFTGDGYHIFKVSPAVNSGVKTPAVADIDDQSIPQSGFPDIGADEFPVECAARLSSNPAVTYGDVQTAVDVAQAGELIKVAGTCTGVTIRNDKTQLLYLDKQVHIQGGYDPENFEVSYPMTQPTTFNALGKGRVLYVVGGAVPTIESVTMQAGNAVGQGGGPDGQDGGGNVYLDGASATFSNTIIADGSAYYGGGVFLFNSGAEFITNTFTLNRAIAGGGVFAQSGLPVLTDNYFESNGATGDGGGIFLTVSPATLDRNTFKGNSAATAGGAVFLDNSPATLRGNNFETNKADSAGGVYLDFSDALVEGNRFVGNEAENAGGLQVARSSGARVTRNSVLENKALNGAGIYIEFSDIEISNNLVVSNTSQNTGSGLYLLGAAPQILHNTFAYNNGGDGSVIFVGNVGTETSAATFHNNIVAFQNVGMVIHPSNSVTADGNLWFGNQNDVSALGSLSEGATRLVVNPVFRAPGAMDFRLASTSPAINVALASAVDKDVEEQPRPTDSASDIGADEYYAPDLTISALTTPEPALAGSEVIFNFQAVNLGNVPLNAAITATLPSVLIGEQSKNWPNITIPVGDVWTDSISGTVPVGYAGPLEYALFIDTLEGVGQALTQTAQAVLPNAAVTIVQSREPAQVLLGKPVRVRIEIQNVGNRLLTLTVTDTLPIQTEPTGILTWTNVSIPSTGSWVQTVTVTPTSAAEKEMVNRIDVSDDLGFAAFHEDTTTIGEPALAVRPLLVPNPVIMGEPFTLTVVVTNTGDVAQPTAITTTIQPEFLGDKTAHTPLLEPQSTISLVIPYQPTSHVGPLSVTVQLLSADGISLTEVLDTVSILRPLKPTIVSVRSGPWSDPTTWQPQRLPNATDVVLVDEGHELNVTAPIAVTSLWNKGVLICPPDGPLVIDASVEIQNIGEIRCERAGDGATPGADGEDGSAIQITTPTLYNEGSIRGGDGGDGANGDPDGDPNGGAGGTGGTGGPVDITTDFLENVGSIRAGDGGNGGNGANLGNNGPGGAGGAGGAGGPTTIELTSPTSELLNGGTIEAGDGGDGGNGGNGNPDGGDGGPGGSGGPLEIVGPTDGQTGDLVDVVNLGTMQAGDGGDGGNGGNGPNGSDGGPGGDGGAVDISGDPDGDGDGSGIDVENGGDVLGGNGGDGGDGGDNVGSGPGSDGGDGGDVKTVGEATFNDGVLQAGDGGNAGGTGPAAGGDGGDAIVLGGQIGPGLIDNLGTIAGGTGGDGNPTATDPQSGGNGGSVVLAATPELILDGGALLGGDEGVGSGGGPDGDGGDVTIATGDGNSGDPPTIALSGPDTLIVARNLIISGGAVVSLDLTRLDPSAILLSGQFLIALGPGSEVDLSDNNGLIFVAGQFTAYADRVTLPPGVSLADLVDGPISVQGSFMRYDARLLLPVEVTGVPGAQVRIPGLLVNLGPLADSYRLAGAFGTLTNGTGRDEAAQGAWSLADLPPIVAVPGSQTRLVPLTVTIPFSAALGSRQPLTVTALSYTDAGVQPAARTIILVQEGAVHIFLPAIRFEGLEPAGAPRKLYMPVVTLGSPGAEAKVESKPEWNWGLWLPLVGE